ncbi:hypothetical protein ACJBST_10590, partial [Streptococcus suis]
KDCWSLKLSSYLLMSFNFLIFKVPFNCLVIFFFASAFFFYMNKNFVNSLLPCLLLFKKQKLSVNLRKAVCWKY